LPAATELVICLGGQCGEPDSLRSNEAALVKHSHHHNRENQKQMHKHIRVYSLVAGIALLVAGLPAAAAAAATASETATAVEEEAMAALPSGQRLIYKIKWGFFTAGTAVVEIRNGKVIDGKPAYEIDLQAWTHGLLGRLYPLRLRVKSLLSGDLHRSLAFRQVQNNRQTDILFDWEQQTAQYVRDGEKRAPIALPDSALDPLALAMAARMQPLQPGTHIEAVFTDGKRCQSGEARVEAVQQVRTPAGRFQAAALVPVLDGVGGVFGDSRDASLVVWISQDMQRLPVRITGKIMLGHLVGELVEVQAL